MSLFKIGILWQQDTEQALNTKHHSKPFLGRRPMMMTMMYTVSTKLKIQHFMQRFVCRMFLITARWTNPQVLRYSLVKNDLITVQEIRSTG